jgi:predicted metal-dependent hydrolase
MSQITVRAIDFHFDEGLSFHWNPDNPQWGNFVNLITLIVPAFERYVIKTTRAAIPRIADPELAQEADLFCRQEAQHSKQHIKHLAALEAQYPGLQALADRVMASYDDLFGKEPLEFHLAYSATAELYLGPLARFMVENRCKLMPNADANIASFILWHFIEEFEHKNAAIDIYKAAGSGYLYRMKCLPKIGQHLLEVKNMVLEGFDALVPQPEAGPANSAIEDMVSAAPLSSRLTLYYGWLCTLLPYHNPDNIKEPQWVRQWHRDYRAGVDMSKYFPQTAP